MTIVQGAGEPWPNDSEPVLLVFYSGFADFRTMAPGKRSRDMTRLRFAILALLLVGTLGSAAGASRAPLLQPGKQTLYERVLTRPGAELLQQPGAGRGTLIDAFTRYYVYGVREVDTHRWLEVGVDSKGTVAGWVDAAYTVPWRQQLAVAFTNPAAQRERALFFDAWDSLEALMLSDDPAAAVAPLTSKIAAGGRDPRVLAIEPDRHIDINSNFYLLPILDYEEVFSESGHVLRGLKVASVTATEASPTPSPPSSPIGQDPATTADTPHPTTTPSGEVRKLQGFRAAVVFVIDSTISMQKYIDEARDAVHQVYQRIERAGMLDRVSFGLVAFRARSADPTRDKGLEYVARMFVNPDQVSSAEGFLAQASALTEAKVTTDHFDEDPYAGVSLALEEIPWQHFGARYLVLITDAGALEGDDSSTGLRAEQLRSAAAAEGVGLFVLHLKTPQGKGDHAAAETQYRTLAANPAIQDSLYIPVETGSLKSYTRAVTTLADSVVHQIEQAARGEPALSPASETQSGQTATPDAGSPQAAETDAETRRIQRLTQAMGHAMQLAYLGRTERTRAPQVFEAWISDRDLANPTVRTVDERVLLTKDQLSDLHNILRQVLDAANAGMLKPDAFFDNLRSLAAQYSRDPNLATQADAQSLADLGLLGEYLEGLPYQSDVMRVDLDTWSRWGTQRQLDFVNRVKSKLRLYERYNADTARWVSLAAGSPPGEHVYPVPLQDLP